MTRLQLIIIGALVVLALIAATVFMLLRPESTTSTSSWEGSGGLFSFGARERLEPVDSAERQGQGTDIGVVTLPTFSESTPPEEFASELTNLLAQLVQPRTQSGDVKDVVPSSYAFIPQGLISVTSEAPRSAEQQALYNYGNALGISLTTFADLHPDMPQILKDQAEDRADPLKVSALKRLAGDFSALGDELTAMDDIPPAAVSTHTALAAAYRDVGDKLARIPDAQGDEAFLQAINTYNTTAETLSARLVALVDLFQSRNTRFSSTDSGSVFTFSANSSF